VICLAHGYIFIFNNRKITEDYTMRKKPKL